MNNILDDSINEINVETPKVRHGCVTAWLIFGIIINSIAALVYIIFQDAFMEIMRDGIPNGQVAPWMIMTLAIIGLVNVFSCILLFQWKKLGFWMFLGTSIVTLVVNLMMGINIVQCGFGLAGVFLLYVILQIKEKNLTAWEQMD